jgi:hypothetical protein
MDYALAMKLMLRFILFGIVVAIMATCLVRADQVEMQNGDRYTGKVLSVSDDIVVVQSEMLGEFKVPRQKVASLVFGTNIVVSLAAANVSRSSASTNLSVATTSASHANTNTDLSAAFRQLGVETNFVGQIRGQMLAGSPEAAGKYDAMVNGLMTGQMNLSDLRREAQSSADQLRELKRDLGPDAGDSLENYLEVLDHFLKESAAEPAASVPPVH